MQFDNLDRIVREFIMSPPPILSDKSLICESTPPVPWFGRFKNARVATLGINPSHAEYFRKIGKNKEKLFVPLDEDKRRLCFWSDKNVQKNGPAVVEACNIYFETGRHYHWFNFLNDLLQQSQKGNYIDGSACHIDISPWTTMKVWRLIGKSDRKILEIEGQELLNSMFAAKKFDMIFVNGKSALEAVQQAFSKPLTLVHKEPKSDLKQSIKIYKGRIHDNRCLAWSANIQAYHGPPEPLKKKLQELICKFVE